MPTRRRGMSAGAGAWVKEQQVVVEDEAIKEFRVNLMLTFVLDD